LTLLLGATFPLDPTHAEDVLPGPVPAQVVRVIDGDTLRVQALIWIGQQVEINVRLDGVDAPELSGACGRERALARQARDLVDSKIRGGAVVLRHIRHGKFAGRVVASVETPDGEDLAALLHDAGLALPYGGGPRASWCETAAAIR
jgi:endonuclease YncB( thermonuclease family)